MKCLTILSSIFVQEEKGNFSQVVWRFLVESQHLDFGGNIHITYFYKVSNSPYLFWCYDKNTETKWNCRKKGFIISSDSKGIQPAMPGTHGITDAGSWLITLLSHTGSRVEEEEVVWGRRALKPTPSDRLPSANLHFLKGSITSQDSTTTKRPSVQMLEHTGDISHSNHHINDQISVNV